MTPTELIETENELVRLWEAGEIPYLTHFMGGNEEHLIGIFEKIRPTDWVFASHRCHFHYQLQGGTDLVEQVLAGRSMFLYGPRFICSAIVAGTASIAAGMALSIKNRSGNEHVWCFGGDGMEDEGNFYEAVRFVHGRQLPATFIIEDNGTTCGVTKEQRGSPDDWMWPPCVIRYRYEMKYPHAGNNTRPKLKWPVSS